MCQHSHYKGVMNPGIVTIWRKFGTQCANTRTRWDKWGIWRELPPHRRGIHCKNFVRRLPTLTLHRISSDLRKILWTEIIPGSAASNLIFWQNHLFKKFKYEDLFNKIISWDYPFKMARISDGLKFSIYSHSIGNKRRRAQFSIYLQWSALKSTAFCLEASWKIGKTMYMDEEVCSSPAPFYFVGLTGLQGCRGALFPTTIPKSKFLS
jgi:hypothetical protein